MLLSSHLNGIRVSTYGDRAGDRAKLGGEIVVSSNFEESRWNHRSVSSPLRERHPSGSRLRDLLVRRVRRSVANAHAIADVERLPPEFLGRCVQFQSEEN
jgi:hypothetical protein